MLKEGLKNLTLVKGKWDGGKQQIIYLSSLCKSTEKQVPQIVAVKEQVLLIIKRTVVASILKGYGTENYILSCFSRNWINVNGMLSWIIVVILS